MNPDPILALFFIFLVGWIVWRLRQMHRLPSDPLKELTTGHFKPTRQEIVIWAILALVVIAGFVWVGLGEVWSKK
jgi:hypothetical protein